MDEIIGESSGETAFNHILAMAGYNRDRKPDEYKKTFLEAQFVKNWLPIQICGPCWQQAATLPMYRQSLYGLAEAVGQILKDWMSKIKSFSLRAQ
jgi:hypothetical protein